MSVWHTLPEAIGLRPSGELIALVGGGGKTSLLFALSGSLSGGIILTTTTRIFAAQMKLAQEVAFFAAESAAHTEQKIGEAVGRTGS